jgi:hypothetical protein
MIAALESHSIGVLSGFPTAPEAFERSFCIRKVPRPPWSHLCFLYPMSRCSEPGYFFYNFSLGFHWIPFAALQLRVGFVFLCHSSQSGSSHDPEELKHCSECSQDNLRIITPPHTLSAYVPSYIVTTRHFPYLALPILREQTVPLPSLSARTSAYASSSPRFWAYTLVRCNYSLVTSILCGPGICQVDPTVWTVVGL